jgi:hypothetical protein
MKPGELELIETTLADKIISEYETEKKAIKNKRFGYLRKKGAAL